MRVKILRQAVLRVFVFIPVLLLLLIQCRTSDHGDHPDVRILIVHSYHIEYPWTRAIDEGIMEVLGNKGFSIKKDFMDTKRNTDEPFKINAGKKTLALIKEFNPTVVILADDNAQEYVGKFLVDKPGLSVVFCGVNADPAQYRYPGNNVTGVCERPFIRNNLNLLKKVAPGIRSYTVITDTSSTSKGFIAYLKSLKLSIRIDKIIETNDLDRWKEEITAITGDAVITYLYHAVRSRGKPVEPKLVMEWTSQHMDKPSIGFSDFAIEDGVLLGHVESGFEHGELAAKLAMEIVKGKKPTEIPIITAQKGMVMVNEKTAARLGIDMTPLKNIVDKVIR